MAVEATTKLGLLDLLLTEMLHTVTLVINTGEAGIAEIVHGTAESAEAKPPPLIVTLVPIGPELGVRVIVGVGTVTVNVVVAKSPVVP